MSLVGSAELHEAINTAWDASSLDAEFTAYWDAGEDADHPVLNDGEASPESPFPYCVYELFAGNTSARMSAEGDSIMEVRDIPGRFTVHAKDSDDLTGREVAAALMEKITAVFGGNATASPFAALSLDNSKHLTTLFVSDFSLRSDDAVFLWTVNYVFRLDVPVFV